MLFTDTDQWFFKLLDAKNLQTLTPNSILLVYFIKYTYVRFKYILSMLYVVSIQISMYTCKCTISILIGTKLAHFLVYKSIL